MIKLPINDDTSKMKINLPKLLSQLGNEKVILIKLPLIVRRSRIISSTCLQYNDKDKQDAQIISTNSSQTEDESKEDFQTTLSHFPKINDQNKKDNISSFDRPKDKPIADYELYCSQCNKSFDKNNKNICPNCGKMLVYNCKNCDQQYTKYKSIYLHGRFRCKFKKQITDTLHCNPNTNFVEDIIEKDNDNIISSSEQPYLKCSYCTFKTKWKRSLRRHYKDIHHKKLPADINANKIGFRKNPQTLHGSKTFDFKCKYCPFQSAYRSSIRRHCKRVHQDELPTSIPMKMNKQLKKIQYFTDIPKFRVKYCSQCQCIYDNDIHIRKCSKCAIKLSWKCKKCYQETNNCSDSAKHIINKHFRNNGFFSCPKCKIKKRNDIQLSTHMKYCYSETYYECKYCTYKTKYPSNQRMHHKRNHPGRPLIDKLEFNKEQ